MDGDQFWHDILRRNGRDLLDAQYAVAELRILDEQLKDVMFRRRNLREWPEHGDDLSAAELVELMKQICNGEQ